MQVPRAATPLIVPRCAHPWPVRGRPSRPAAQHHPLKDPAVDDLPPGADRRVSAMFLRRLFYATVECGEPRLVCEQSASSHDVGTSRFRRCTLLLHLPDSLARLPMLKTLARGGLEDASSRFLIDSSLVTVVVGRRFVLGAAETTREERVTSILNFSVSHSKTKRRGMLQPHSET
ncbi:unnamed protein product, partial [Ixodes hexagonus]